MNQPKPVTKFLVAKGFIKSKCWENKKCVYICHCPTCENSFKDNFEGIEDDIYKHWKSLGLIIKTDSEKELVCLEQIEKVSNKLKKTRSRDTLLNDLVKENTALDSTKKNHSSPNLEQLRLEASWKDVVKGDIADGNGNILKNPENNKKKPEDNKPDFFRKFLLVLFFIYMLIIWEKLT